MQQSFYRIHEMWINSEVRVQTTGWIFNYATTHTDQGTAWCQQFYETFCAVETGRLTSLLHTLQKAPGIDKVSNCITSPFEGYQIIYYRPVQREQVKKHFTNLTFAMAIKA